MTTQEERDAIEWEESWARYDALTAKKRAVLNHTPGPWVVTDDRMGVFSANMPLHQNKVIASCNAVAREKEENEANARLIAAAPELLAKARLDLAAFDRIVELIEEARTSRNLDAILDIMTDYAGSPALADVVKRLGTTTPA